MATNRINTPELAERLLAEGACDMVSMARPFLADADFVRKARTGRADEINTCIGCNQACLDHTFGGKITSCLVNPRACNETELVIAPTAAPKRLAVVGAGPAGLAFATTAAERGHQVTLFEADDQIGGQFNLAKTIPGKEEFHETLRYFRKRIELTGVTLRTGHRATAEELAAGGFDAVILATGVVPREPEIAGRDHPKVLGYLDVLRDRKPVGDRVAIIGAGGIGFDVAELLTHGETHGPDSIKDFGRDWGVDTNPATPGGLGKPAPRPAARQVQLLQRKAGRPGAGLGKTTGWIHRAALQARGVTMTGGVTYERIDDDGLVVTAGGETRVIPADSVVICAGQEPERSLAAALEAAGCTVHLIGGADLALELDAKRAIDQGTRLAATF